MEFFLQSPAGGREAHQAAPAVVGGDPALDQSELFEPVDSLGDRARCDHHGGTEFSGAEGERIARAAQRREHVEVTIAETCLGEHVAQPLVEQIADSVQTADNLHRPYIQVRSFACPLCGDRVDGVGKIGHDLIVSSTESKISSMETSVTRALPLAAVAPLVWGTTYLVTESFLPPDRPLLAATLRALPAGLVLLALRRKLPRGDWWWRSLVLGLLNIGLFFPLIFLAAYQLPGGVASTLQAGSPLVVMGLAWAIIGERATVRRVAAGLIGITGVALLVLRGGTAVTAIGVAAGLGSVVVSGIGFVMIKKWTPPVDMVTLVAWQLVWGGLFLLPVTAAVEGAPPSLTATNIAAYLWLGSVGTVVAYVCWFTGLRRISAGAVSLVGLLNPLVGTVLGVVFAHEAFGPAQATGAALVLTGVAAGQSLRIRAAGRRSGSGSTADLTPPRAVPVAPVCR